jgi:hypothetical protein
MLGWFTSKPQAENPKQPYIYEYDDSREYYYFRMPFTFYDIPKGDGVNTNFITHDNKKLGLRSSNRICNHPYDNSDVLNKKQARLQSSTWLVCKIAETDDKYIVIFVHTPCIDPTVTLIKAGTDSLHPIIYGDINSKYGMTYDIFKTILTVPAKHNKFLQKLDHDESETIFNIWKGKCNSGTFMYYKSPALNMTSKPQPAQAVVARAVDAEAFPSAPIYYSSPEKGGKSRKRKAKNNKTRKPRK